MFSAAKLLGSRCASRAVLSWTPRYRTLHHDSGEDSEGPDVGGSVDVGDEQPLTYMDVLQAHRRIRGVVKQSPMRHSPRFSKITGLDVQFKMEHQSITGSYKERGALNRMRLMSAEERERGVVCSSAGNHAQAVSYHSTRLGIPSVIVMPETTPVIKVESTRAFGGKVVLKGESFQEAYEHAMEIAEARGLVFIHAFNDRAIVAGQGTVAIEMMEQSPFLDALVIPVGGGGLLAGMALVTKHINPRIKVYGVEAEAMPGMYESFKNRRLTSVTKRPTVADGMAIENVGAIPFESISKFADDIVTVDEDEISQALLMLLEREKTVVEGSGATGLAAILSGKLQLPAGSSVGVVLTGGNIDPALLGRIIEKGMVKNGRLMRVTVTIPDVPGALLRICSVLSAHRANIRDVEHERAFLVDHVGFTQPSFTVETRNREHQQEIVEALRKGGFERVEVTRTVPHE